MSERINPQQDLEASTPSMSTKKKRPTAEWVQADIAIEIEFQNDGTPLGATAKYTIRNLADVPIVVFDDGSTRDPDLRSRVYRLSDSGDLKIIESLVPIPDPAPTMPLVAIGRQVDPGELHESAAEMRLASTYPVRGDSPERATDKSDQPSQQRAFSAPLRVQYCVGVARLEPDLFTPLSSNAKRWVPAQQVTEQQVLLCSEWTSLNNGG